MKIEAPFLVKGGSTRVCYVLIIHQVIPAVEVENSGLPGIDHGQDENRNPANGTANSSESDITEMPQKDERKCSDVELDSTHVRNDIIVLLSLFSCLLKP
jgi:hypothetical protein